MIHSFILTREHTNFLSEERKDPITQDSLEVGDEIVFCAECKSAYLKDTWLFKNEECCEQKSTLSQFPISRPLNLGTRAESGFNTQINSRPIIAANSFNLNAVTQTNNDLEMTRLDAEKKLKKAILNVLKFGLKVLTISAFVFFIINIVAYFTSNNKESNVNQVEHVEELAVEKEDIANLNSEQENINSVVTKDTIIELPKEKEIAKNDNLSKEPIVKQENKSNEKTTLKNQTAKKQNIDYLSIEDYKEGLALVKTKEGYGFIDKQGNQVVEPKYEKAYGFSEGKAGVLYHGLYGFIDKEGNTIIDFKYDKVFSFSEGFAVVVLRDNYGVINENEKIIIPLEYRVISNFQQGIAVACKDKCGLINANNKFITPIDYDGIGNLSDGLRVATKKVEGRNKKGYIDNKGMEIIPFIYNYAADFVRGTASVSNDMSYFFRINKNGTKMD